MRRAAVVPGLALLLALGLAACGERPQTASHKVDAKAWESQEKGFDAAGWKGGDRTAWELQLRQRAQNQNEYVRAAAQ